MSKSAKSKPTPSKYSLVTAKSLAADGYSPDSVQQRTGLALSIVRQVFLSMPERARQWGLRP